MECARFTVATDGHPRTGSFREFAARHGFVSHFDDVTRMPSPDAFAPLASLPPSDESFHPHGMMYRP